MRFQGVARAFFPALRGLLLAEVVNGFYTYTFFPALRGLLLILHPDFLRLVLSSPRCGGYSGTHTLTITKPDFLPRVAGVTLKRSYTVTKTTRFLPRVAGVILAEIHLNFEWVDAFFPAMRGLLCLSGVFIKQ